MLSSASVQGANHFAKRRKLSHGSENNINGFGQDTQIGGRARSIKISNSSDIAEPDSDVNGNSFPDESYNQDISLGNAPEPRPAKARQTKSISQPTLSTGTANQSILSIQVRELLAELRANQQQADRQVKVLADTVTQAVKSTPIVRPLSIKDTERYARDVLHIHIPWSHKPSTDSKYTFAFEAPSKCSITDPQIRVADGKTQIELEILVAMPDSLFQEKDYLDYRAFQKRSFYLACIAQNLKKLLDPEFRLQFRFRDDNNLLPVLVVRHEVAEMRGPGEILLNINPCFPSSLGPIDKTLPSKNCVRSPQWASESDTTLHDPTPFYNATLRMTSSFLLLEDVIQQVTKKCPAFKDACLLGETWLSQRECGSTESEGGFGRKEWELMSAILLNGGGHQNQPLFSDRYSAFQLFKAMLQVLSSRNLREPFVVGNDSSIGPTGDQPTLFHSETGINVMYKITAQSYELLQHYASSSIAILNAKSAKSFESAFIFRVAEPLLQFDEIYSIDISSLVHGSDTKRANHLIRLQAVLHKGLGDRVRLLKLCATPSLMWDIEKKISSSTSNIIRLGLLLNPDRTSQTIDHGPPAEDQAGGKSFREFWGDKAELRRFKDGRINESLIWSASKPVTEQIIRWLSILHFKLPPSAVGLCHLDLEQKQLSQSRDGSDTDTFRIVYEKYQSLASKLHQLVDVPLPIRSVSAADEALCSASLCQPMNPQTSQPINITVQFDSSSRWPDSLPAIQRTKIAFLIKLGDLLSEQDKSISIRVGIENAEMSVEGLYNNAFLDIIYPPPVPMFTSLIFRMRIHHERELHLIQTQLNQKNLHGMIRDNLQSALQTYKQQFVAKISHTAAVRSLVTQFPPLSGTIRLLKSWIASHHLSNCIKSDILDILACHIFLHPSPWSTPGNSTTAFFRILHLLSYWDWAVEPLITDLSLSQDMSGSQRSEIETRFQAWRKLDPNMNVLTWFVGTNIDPTGTVWTQGSESFGGKPSRVVAGRITALARASMEFIKSQGFSLAPAEAGNLFMSPLTDFDFVLHLHPSYVKGGRTAKKQKRDSSSVEFKNIALTASLDTNAIGHDVVSLYLADLENAFRSSAVFFYGGPGSGSTVIAGLWRPTTNGVKTWRVGLGMSSVPVSVPIQNEDVGENKAKCMINKSGMLAEMAMLGRELVSKVWTKEG